MLQNATFREEFHSFLAVRRSGVVEPGQKSKLKESAEKRAYEVAALMTLTFLSVNKQGETCGLVEQLHRRSKSIAMLELEEGGFAFHGGGGSARMILDQKHNVKMCRSELKRFLWQRRFAGLTDILLSQKSPVASSLKNAVTQSAIRLSDAIHANAISSQLLGSVTAVEVLLGDLGDSFDTLKSRLAALLGKEATDRYQADDVFWARHRYVHKGEEVSDSSISSKSIALALLALLTYADAAQAFESKAEIVCYLDFLNSVGRLSKRILKDNKVFSLLVKSRRVRPTIAFV